jgi:MFS family permease
MRAPRRRPLSPMSATPHQPSDRSRAHPTVTLVVLSLAALAYSMLSSAVVPALPAIQHAIGASETGIAWLLTGYLLSASVATSILGRLGDMYGKERLLLVTLILLMAGTLVAALASSLWLLILARVIQGAGGGIFPLAMGIVRDEFPREKVAGSIGLLSALLGIGGGIGIVLAGVIIQHLDYHWLFWIPLIVLAVSAVLTRRFVPESPVRTPGSVNWVAAGLMTAGITMTLIAVSETTTWGWGSARTIGLLTAGLVVCALWVAWEARSRQPLVDMEMMRLRGVWTTNLAAFLLGAGMYSSFIVIPQFVQLPRSTGFGSGASVVLSGLYLLPSTATMSATFLAGHLAHGLPTVIGFEQTFVMATALLVVCVLASMLVPRPGTGAGPAATGEREPEPVEA